MGNPVKGSNQYKKVYTRSSPLLEGLKRLCRATRRITMVLVLIGTVLYAGALVARHAMPEQYDLVAIFTDRLENVFYQPSYTAPFTMVAHAEGKVEIPPIMQKIAKAESGGEQFCSEARVRNFTPSARCKCYKVGAPLMCTNTNQTLDVGAYQINSIHWAQADKMGFDVVNSEEDNRDFALYLYATEGTSPWSSSSKMWKK